MNNDMQSLLNEFQAKFEKIADEGRRRMEEATQEYEAALTDAQAKLEAATDGTVSEDSANEADSVPAAAWINAPDGERMMVLNQEAVVMFMAIFDRMSEVAEALQKLTKK